MNSFLKIHEAATTGTLATFDRMVFKGHLTNLYKPGNFARYLWSQEVPLLEFGEYAQRVTGTLKQHALGLAEKAGRPYQYLEQTASKRSGQSKQDLAEAIAGRDGVKEGLVCVLSAVEPCRAFSIQGNPRTKRREAVLRSRKCLHFYFYFLDPEFGLMHVRLQSWFPFTIQIYLNGRAWLARQLERKGIAYEMYENCFTRIERLDVAQHLCERFAHRHWPRVLDAFARKVNPWLSTLRAAGLGGYYWVLDQSEYATDVMFKRRAALQALLPQLMETGMSTFSSADVLRFLGRKMDGRLKGEITSDFKHRPEGRRVKHRMRQNSIKIYDKWSVLRVETTINNPREFKVLRVHTTRRGQRSRRWLRMAKGVAQIWRYAQVSSQANQRYLNALARVDHQGKAVRDLDRLCRPRLVRGKHYARFNPITDKDCRLFRAVLCGDHTIHGFRNRDLQERLSDAAPRTRQQQKRLSTQLSRQLAKLRAHGLIAKVPHGRRYHVTERGLRIMSAATRYRDLGFPSLPVAA